jgi:hypothetical protein
LPVDVPPATRMLRRSTTAPLSRAPWQSPRVQEVRDRARTSPALSMCITALIQRSCTANRFDASVTKAANGLASDALARCATTDARSAYAALLH